LGALRARSQDAVGKIPAILMEQRSFEYHEALVAFDHITLGPFGQNTADWVNPVTKVLYPATFDYYAALSARRRSDSVDFCIMVHLDHAIVDVNAGEPLRQYVDSRFQVAILTMAGFSNCACTAEKPCERHPR